MTQGDIVLVIMPQKDGRKKKRPALVLKKTEPFQDCLVCGISSKLQHEIEGFDVVIRKGEEGFSKTGLKCSSVIRLGFITTIAASRIPGVIGRIRPDQYDLIMDRLVNFLRPG